MPGKMAREPGVGHNQPPPVITPDNEQLRGIVERVERLNAEKKGIADDVRDVLTEAKSLGYDAKMVRKVVALRAMKPDDRREMETTLELYLAALGME